MVEEFKVRNVGGVRCMEGFGGVGNLGRGEGGLMVGGGFIGFWG